MPGAPTYHDLFTTIVQASAPAQLEALVPQIVDWPDVSEAHDLAHVWYAQWRTLTRDPVNLKLWGEWMA